MLGRTSVFAGVLVLALGAAALAAPERPLVFERLGPEDGLPHNTVNDILQDGRGFLWLATDGGLSRYDGYTFTNHRIDPASGASNVLMALLEDSTGALWVGSETGLWRFDRDTHGFVAAAIEGASNAVQGYTEALLEDRLGRLWVGIGEGLYRKEPDSPVFRRIRVPGEPFERLWSLAEDSGGGVWAVAGDLNALRPELRRVSGVGDSQPVVTPIAGRFHTLVHVDSGDRFWVGPLAASATGARVSRAVAPGVEAYLNEVLELDDGSFWLASAEGLYSFDPASDKTLRHPLRSDAPTWQSEQARSILVDHAGGLWVGTLGGLFHHDPYSPDFRHWGHDPGDPSSLSADAISDIVAGPDGGLWIGTFGGGLNRVDPASGRAERFRHDPDHPDSLPDDVVWSLAWDGESRLWVGARTPSVFDPRTGTFEPLPTGDESGPPTATPVALHADGSDRIWLATHGPGLYVYRLDARSWDRFPDLDAYQIVGSGPDALWIASTGWLARLDSATGRAERFPVRSTEGEPLGEVAVFDLAVREDVLWVATTAGLGRFALDEGSWRLPVAVAELPGTVVYSIQPDHRGRLWLGTNQGLVRFSPGAPPGRRVRTYDRGDGTGNVEFNRHSRYRSPDGTIYMGGMSGVTVFDPAGVREDPTVPPVLITGIVTLGEGGRTEVEPRGLAELELPPGAAEVTFSFTAIDFSRAERSRYAYKLEGFDADWIDAGTQRIARYTNIPPGSYVFRARATNADGVWNREGPRLPVEVLPSLWQTWWFRLLVAAGLVAALTVAYRLRARRLVEIERMRLRIAGDLHDELGSELSGIALATSRLADRQYLEEADRERLEEVRTSSVQVMQGLRDVVWYVNPDHDNVRSLHARMRSAAALLLAGLEHRFDADVPDELDTAIDMRTRRDMYLVYKELLTNVVRHADATHVEVRLVARGTELLLEVQDDGVGFDPAAVTDGTGLASIRRRVARMGADLEIDSRPGAGTRVRVRTRMTRTRQSDPASGQPRMDG